MRSSVVNQTFNTARLNKLFDQETPTKVDLLREGDMNINVNKVESLFKIEENIDIFEQIVGNMEKHIIKAQSKNNKIIEEIINQNKDLADSK